MVKTTSQKLRAELKGLEAENPELLPKLEHSELLPKAEPKKKKKKKKSTIILSVDSEGNPIADVQKSIDEKQPQLLPKPEQKPEVLPNPEQKLESEQKPEVLSNPEPTSPTIPKKKWEKRKRKTAVPVDVANPLVDASKSIEVEQLVQLPKPELLLKTEPRPELLPNPEPIVPKKKWEKRRKTAVPVDGANPVVDDAPKSIVENMVQLPMPEPIVPTVPVKKWTKRQRKTSVPVDGANPASKSIEVENMVQLPKPEPLVPTVPSKKRKRKKSKTTVPVDGANPFVDVANRIVVEAPKSMEGEQMVQLPIPEPVLPTVPSKKKKKKGTSTDPGDGPNPVVDAPKSVEVEQQVQLPKQPEPTLPRYVEICVICRKIAHSIPACPELNDNSKPGLNDRTEPTPGKKKKNRNRRKNKPSQCPQPPQDVEMKAGQEDRLLVTGGAPQTDSTAQETNGGKEDEFMLKAGSASHSQESQVESKKEQDLVTGTCALQDDSMAEGENDGKEEESILKAGFASHSQERLVEPMKIQDLHVMNSVA